VIGTPDADDITVEEVSVEVGNSEIDIDEKCNYLLIHLQGFYST
jgi:hypothetical protein